MERSYKKTIVVFGCTGTVGKPVLEKLLQENCNVRGIIRTPNRKYPIPIEKHSQLSYMSADMGNPKEVDAACAFADVIFLLTATAPNQVANEINVINAAKKNDIKRIIKISAPDIQPQNLVEVSKWHREIETYLDDSNIEHCCIRPYAFMQNWERNTFTIRKFGKIFGVMKEAPRNYVDARDVAEVAVKLLLQKKPLEAKNISITGPEAISHYKMAERISKVTNRTIEYVNLSKEEYLKNLTKRAKLPLWLANHIVELDELAVKIKEPNKDSIENLLHKKPRLMNAYLQEKKDIFAKQSLWGK